MRSIREYFGMRALINCFAFFAVTLSSNTNLGTHNQQYELETEILKKIQEIW